MATGTGTAPLLSARGLLQLVCLHQLEALGSAALPAATPWPFTLFSHLHYLKAIHGAHGARLQLQ